MVKKIIEKLKENDGGTYLELSITFLIVMMIISAFIMILPVFVKIDRMNDLAGYTARIISLEGEVKDSVSSEINEYIKEVGLQEVTIDMSGSEFFEGKKIQLNKRVAVSVNSDYKFSVFGISFSIPLHVKAYARSEVYHK